MTTYLDIPTVSESDMRRPDFQSWLSNELARRTQANRVTYSNALDADQQLMVLVARVYGENSAPHKYMRRQNVPTPPDLYRRAKKLQKRYETWLAEERQRQYQADYRRRR